MGVPPMPPPMGLRPLWKPLRGHYFQGTSSEIEWLTLWVL